MEIHSRLALRIVTLQNRLVLIRVVTPCFIALNLLIPSAVSVSSLQNISYGHPRLGVSDSILPDLATTIVSRPGYSNGNLAYLQLNTTTTLASSSIPVNPCLITGYTINSFAPSPNFGGEPPLRVTLTAFVSCGKNPYSALWQFGDGNSSSQQLANESQDYPPGGARFIYNHTYTYIGSFIASISITDSNGNKVEATTNIYVSFVPSLYYSYYNEGGLIGKGITGNTYSIGLVEECFPSIPESTYQSDLSTFDNQFDVQPTPTLQFLTYGTGPCYGSNWNPIETSLDIEWAHVAAPGAKIYVCFDTTSTVAGLEGCDSLLYQNRTADNIMIGSNSWGTCAIGYIGAIGLNCVNGPDSYAAIWQQSESAGMTLFASTGDFQPNAECAGLNYPSSNPYGVAVGGTTISSVGSSGSYGSEVMWYKEKQATQCYVQIGPNLEPVQGEIGETYGQNEYYTAPSWQSSLLNNNYRYVPDVSMVANSTTGVPVYSQGSWQIVGGTSVGAPIWAGILDILFQAGAPGLSGFAAPFLYAHSSCFHVVTNIPTGGRDGLGTPNVGCLAMA